MSVIYSGVSRWASIAGRVLGWQLYCRPRNRGQNGGGSTTATPTCVVVQQAVSRPASFPSTMNKPAGVEAPQP